MCRGRLLWQARLLSTAEEASRAPEMVLCGSPGETGVRKNTLRQAPHVVDAPTSTPSRGHCGGVEEQGGLAIPAFYDGMPA